MCTLKGNRLPVTTIGYSRQHVTLSTVVTELLVDGDGSVRAHKVRSHVTRHKPLISAQTRGTIIGG